MERHSTNPGEELHAIRDIMERSSKFLSLSGLSGIFAGTAALGGAAVAWFFLLDSGNIPYYKLEKGGGGLPGSGPFCYLALDAAMVLVLAFLGAVFFSWRKARKAGENFWTNSARRVIFHLMVPLVTGGIFTAVLVLRGQPELIASVLLIFYGLSLVNAGKYTVSEIQYLGLTEIILGILACVWVSLGFLCWIIGFGLMHLIYGAVMYYRYEGKK